MGLVDRRVGLSLVLVAAVPTVDVEGRLPEVPVEADVVLHDPILLLELRACSRAGGHGVRAADGRIVEGRSEPTQAAVEVRQLLDAATDTTQLRITVVGRRLQVACAYVDVRIGDTEQQPAVDRRLTRLDHRRWSRSWSAGCRTRRLRFASCCTRPDGSRL